MINDEVNARDLMVGEMAKNIMGALVFSHSIHKRAEGDAPFHLDVAALVYILAMHNCAMADEDPEALKDHLMHTIEKVSGAINQGALHNQKDGTSAH